MQCSPFRLVASRSHNPEEGAGPEDFNGPTPHAGLLHRVGARDRHLGGFSNNDHQRCPPSGEESHSRKVEVMRERWRSFERVFCCTSLSDVLNPDLENSKHFSECGYTSKILTIL